MVCIWKTSSSTLDCEATFSQSCHSNLRTTVNNEARNDDAAFLARPPVSNKEVQNSQGIGGSYGACTDHTRLCKEGNTLAKEEGDGEATGSLSILWNKPRSSSLPPLPCLMWGQTWVVWSIGFLKRCCKWAIFKGSGWSIWGKPRDWYVLLMDSNLSHCTTQVVLCPIVRWVSHRSGMQKF